jgi:hypothetical protein
MLLLPLIISCQSMMYGSVKNISHLSIGMTKAEVIKELGEPFLASADSDRHEEYLSFKKMREWYSWAPRLYRVTFRDGKDIRWGEEN